MSAWPVGRRHAALALAVAALLAVRAAPVGAGSAKGKAPRAAAAATVTEPVHGPQVRGFQAFCDVWMQKLRDREIYNTSHIAWDHRDGHVIGEYVSYARECTCEAREEPGKDPIGKITYREVRYRREGTTPVEALAAPGTIVEQSDVTEIFRYGKGAWQY
jgi:hypothetical protein